MEIPSDLLRLDNMKIGTHRDFVRRFGTVRLERIEGAFYLTTNGEYTWSLSDASDDVNPAAILRMIDFAIRLGNLRHDCPLIQNIDYDQYFRGIVGTYETVIELNPTLNNDIEYSFGVFVYCTREDINTELYHSFNGADGFAAKVGSGPDELGNVWKAMGITQRGLNLYGSAMDWTIAIVDHHVDPILAKIGHNLEGIARAFRKVNTDVLDWWTV